MRKPKANPHFVDNYKEVRAKAQSLADELGFDYGVEKDYFGFRSFMLPRKENRFGCETRCEVVYPSNLDKCQPGHGPAAKGR
jgi:hypothetical protein